MIHTDAVDIAICDDIPPVNSMHQIKTFSCLIQGTISCMFGDRLTRLGVVCIIVMVWLIDVKVLPDLSKVTNQATAIMQHDNVKIVSTLSSLFNNEHKIVWQREGAAWHDLRVSCANVSSYSKACLLSSWGKWWESRNHIRTCWPNQPLVLSNRETHYLLWIFGAPSTVGLKLLSINPKFQAQPEVFTKGVSTAYDIEIHHWPKVPETQSLPVGL